MIYSLFTRYRTLTRKPTGLLLKRLLLLLPSTVKGLQLDAPEKSVEKDIAFQRFRFMLLRCKR